MSERRRKRVMRRRGFLASAGGAVMLQSLATGVPAKILLDPLSASADDRADAKMLILSSSRKGDPVGTNAPGTYGLADVAHPQHASMVETPLTLAGTSTSAAKPWADLSQTILDRTLFFHHATNTPVHGDMDRVQRMMDAAENNDMLISLLAREVAPILGTVQSDPLSLGAEGAELITSEGRTLGNVAPLSVRQALGGVEGPLSGLVAMRDKQIDRIYALYREHGTPKQRDLLDAWARSRDEVRSIGASLLSKLDSIDGNDQVNQVRTAAVLAAMKIAPVITVHIEFGGDNHFDPGLDLEAEQNLSGIDTLRILMEELEQLKTEGNLSHGVLVGSLNVFGRTMKDVGASGRDHNQDHHCLVLMGDGIRGGIVGGLALNEAGTEYRAQAIDSTTGQGGADGDIVFDDTLGAAGKTLGAAMGVGSDRLDELVPPGKIVQSAFV